MSAIIAISLVLTLSFGNVAAAAASRRTNFTTVLLLASPAALLLAVAAALVAPGQPNLASLSWGLLAGLVGGAALPVAYHALALGPVGVVAPVIACTSTISLALVSCIVDGLPSGWVWLGLGVCLVAIVLLGQKRLLPIEPPPEAGTPRPRVSAVAWAVMAGLGFAAFVLFISAAQAQDEGLWPLVAARIAVLATTLLLPFIITRPHRPTLRIGLLAITVGFMDTFANLLLFAALARTSLVTVAVLEAAVPGITALISVWLLREKLHGRQRIGITLAVIGAAVAALG